MHNTGDLNHAWVSNAISRDSSVHFLVVFMCLSLVWLCARLAGARAGVSVLPTRQMMSSSPGGQRLPPAAGVTSPVSDVTGAEIALFVIRQSF